MTAIRRAAGYVGAMAVTVVFGALLVPATPAAASSTAFAPDTFSLCSSSCKDGAASGTIVWGNRVAEVSGSVTDSTTELATSVGFDAYAGNTLVEHQSRTVSNAKRSYRFPIGDPNLRGGIDRIIIKVCTDHTFGDDGCAGGGAKRD